MPVTQARCEQLVSYWRGVFDLPLGWQIACVIHATRDEADAEDTDGEGTPAAPAYVRIQYGYSRATIHVNSYLVSDDDELVYATGHEVAHVRTHRYGRLVASSLGAANADTAEEMCEELAEMMIQSALRSVRTPPPPPEVPPAEAPAAESASIRRRRKIQQGA